MAKAEKRGVNLVLPVDVVVTEEINAEAKGRVVPIDRISPQVRIADIGPRTIKNFREELRKCKTIFWNGPMGVYEVPQFAEGTRAMAEILGNLKATTVVGGGSTAEVVTDLGLDGKMTFVSTGGGASMTFLSGEKLPGVEALLNRGSTTAARLKKRRS
jgi:phosphoglycerate kinase